MPVLSRGLSMARHHNVVAASDLHAKRPPNSMMKYADDSYLLVGSRQISTVNEEFSHIKAWAASNNLQLNPLKPESSLSTDAALAPLLTQPPSSRVLAGLPLCGSLVLPSPPTFPWAAIWTRSSPLACRPFTPSAC